ncbi:hypothetical protein PAHAL_6G056900 [Panicum hallii]|jgi:hypothetical protein|uniref:Uncharacterized protein n=1 Tax=Panicum hallii TaxID=206008 RepID=A0A2S3I0Q7_9POAL|nr:hypothetical protein PAHAL_6G056900 [Panicum hallii]
MIRSVVNSCPWCTGHGITPYHSCHNRKKIISNEYNPTVRSIVHGLQFARKGEGENLKGAGQIKIRTARREQRAFILVSIDGACVGASDMRCPGRRCTSVQIQEAAGMPALVCIPYHPHCHAYM